MSVADNPTAIVFRPAPEPGMLHAGSKGVAVYKLICCLAVVVEPGEGQMGNVGFTNRIEITRSFSRGRRIPT